MAKRKVGFTLPYTKYKCKAPTDNSDSKILSVVLFNQSTLDELVKVCKPAAGASEFQVHYRSLIIRAVKDDREFIITIPTVFYNFPQKVSGSAVNYHLLEVTKAGNSAQALSTVLATNYSQEVSTIISQLQQVADVSVYESNSGSIHRHPGDFGFSSIDYDNDPENPGVIYRNKVADNHVQTDSVIYIPYTGDVKVVTTETRIVNVKPADDEIGIEGTYTKVPTVTYVYKDTDSNSTVSFSSILGGTEVKEKPIFTTIKSSIRNTNYPLLDEIKSIFSGVTTKQNTLLVDSENIKPAFPSYNKGVYGRNVYNKTANIGNKTTKTKKAYDFLDEHIDDGYYDNEGYPSLYGQD